MQYNDKSELELIRSKGSDIRRMSVTDVKKRNIKTLITNGFKSAVFMSDAKWDYKTYPGNIVERLERMYSSPNSEMKGLYVQGEVGTGKTTLAHLIAFYLTNQSKRLFGRQFTPEYRYFSEILRFAKGDDKEYYDVRDSRI
jgi:predicted ATPase